MSTPAPPGATIPEAPQPICPHCDEPMPTINGYPYVLGPFAIFAVLCTNCRVLLHMQVFQTPQEPAEPGSEPNPTQLWKPS